MAEFSFKWTTPTRFILEGVMGVKEFHEADMSTTLSEMMVLDKQIVHEYKDSLADDGKLVGQEKANLSSLIQRLVVCVVAFRLFIEKRVKQGEIVSSKCHEQGYGFQISHTGYNFHMSGELSSRVLSQVKQFGIWHEETFWPVYETLVKTIEHALHDRHFTTEEGGIISDALDKMLFSLVQIYIALTFKDLSC